MTAHRLARTILVTVSFLSLSALTAHAQASHPAAHADAGAAIHEAYVEAINSNDLGRLLGIMTDDVVFMAPNSAPVVGKAAIKPWLEGYLAAYKTRWDKTVEEFVVSGDWAFERYSYKSTDTPRDGGDVIQDTGWGLVIYHHDSDGTWRVARDAWGSDRPLGG